MVSSRISHHFELFSNNVSAVVENDCYESSKYSHQKNPRQRRQRQQQQQQQRRLPSFFIIIAISLLLVLHNSSSPLFLVVQAASTNSAAASAAIIRNRNGSGQNQIRRNSNILSERRISFVDKAATVLSNFPRGGAGDVNIFGTTTIEEDEEEEENEEDNANDNNSNDVRTHPEYDKLLAYRMKQQVLLQLRATALSEALVARGLPLPSLRDVSTLDGKLKPKKVDWDCALSTEEDPKHCLISYEPEVGSKLIVPMELADDTDKWITLRELNRLRREDPSKVEPMWSDKYAVLSSWFSPQSRYSLLQHVGVKGVLLNTLLEGSTLSVVVGMLLVLGIIICMPVIEYIVGRFLVSGYLWMKWASWARFVHVGLPFKLVIFQIVFGQASKLFAKLVSLAKDNLVNLECKILEETIPLTVGVPTILDEEEEEVVEHLKENDDDDE